MDGKSPKVIKNATEAEKAEMLAITQEEQLFYIQDNPKYFGTMTFVQFKKFSWGYGATVILWDMNFGEVSSHNVEFGRCPKCGSPILMEDMTAHCPNCFAQWPPLFE